MLPNSKLRVFLSFSPSAHLYYYYTIERTDLSLFFPLLRRHGSVPGDLRQRDASHVRRGDEGDWRAGGTSGLRDAARQAALRTKRHPGLRRRREKSRQRRSYYWRPGAAVGRLSI